MKRSGTLALGLMSLSLVPVTGCIIIADFDPWDSCGSCVWVEGPEQRVTLDAAGLEGIEVRTHNGGVTFTGSSGEAYVVYRAKAGGRSRDDAEEALDALDVFVNRSGDGVEHMGWRWREQKHRSWSASVSFEIHAPESCKVNVRTHNGGVTVNASSGDVDVETHNGGITVQSSGDQLTARTHNGPIKTDFGGRDLNVETHNGGIVADLSRCGAIDGRIVTHNGGVRVTVGTDASTTVQASTNSGGITCRVPLTESEITRRSLRGRIGAGSGSLTIDTHNGSVRIDGVEG